jgi:pyridoxal phosphate enzyme (YggS family)
MRPAPQTPRRSDQPLRHAMSERTAIADALATVRSRIAEACARAGRDPSSVSVVAVSKAHERPAIEAAIAAGQKVFGENRVQEAQAKYTALKSAHRGLKLHLIGPLQTNKAAAAVELFDVIETLDRPRLAEVIAREIARQKRKPGLFIQVNTGEEPQKAGIPKPEADEFIHLCLDAWDLPVRGLMCIPPLDEDPAPHFAWLADCARRHGLGQLSMGMSGDFETAIAHGATHVRLGTAIFGARPAPSRG